VRLVLVWCWCLGVPLLAGRPRSGAQVLRSGGSGTRVLGYAGELAPVQVSALAYLLISCKACANAGHFVLIAGQCT
jgi:hypothetical protein